METKRYPFILIAMIGLFLTACAGMEANMDSQVPEPNAEDAAETADEQDFVSGEANVSSAGLEPVADQPPGGLSLADETWVLAQYGSPDQPEVMVDGVVISLEYQPVQGRLGGTSGCNQYFGGVTVDEEKQTFSVGVLGMTRRACAQPVMEQETAFIAMLEQVVRYEILDRTLYLYTEGGDVLSFVPGEAPSGRQ